MMKYIFVSVNHSIREILKYKWDCITTMAILWDSITTMAILWRFGEINFRKNIMHYGFVYHFGISIAINPMK